MKKHKSIADIVKVTFSNFALLLAGVATSFILPKYFSLTDFGNYKIFNLYSTYIILLQFGIAEGIYLKYGGKKLDDVSHDEFTGYLKTTLLVESVVAAIIIALAFNLPGDYKTIFLFLAINIIITNFTNIYQFLSQSVQRFSELSFRNVLKSVFIVLAVFAIVIINRFTNYKVGYELLLALLTLINLLLLLWYIFTYRSLLSRHSKINPSKAWNLFKIGFPLCLSNIISSLILTMDRQIVSLGFATSEYAIYSFAYSLLTLASTIITSIAVVLFPILKQKSISVLKKEYSQTVSLICVTVGLMAISYFPLAWFVKRFLPLYTGSIDIFRIIIPGLIITSPISIVMHNYYKTLGLNMEFFVRSLVTLILAIASNIIAFIIFHSMSSISIASIFVLSFWYCIEEYRLKKEFNFKSVNNACYIVLICSSFYASSFFLSLRLGALVYFISFLAITLIMKRESILNYYNAHFNKELSNE